MKLNIDPNIKKIIVCGGGTGGHLFPAIALAENLAKNKLQCHLITDDRCKKYLQKNEFYQTYVFSLKRPGKTLWQKLQFYSDLFRAILINISIIFKIKPKVIVGFGGYPTVAPLIAAWILRVPIVIHESNSIMGRANKKFACIAKIISTAFSETTIDAKYQHKIVNSGDVIRESVKNLSQDKHYLQNNTFKLFVFGGSQGARFFDDLIPAVIEILQKKYPHIHFKITQQTSIDHCKSLRNTYNDLEIDNEISDFFHNIENFYQKADIVICRAGASTIAELAAIKQPAIYIPLPSSLDNHQLHNAQKLAQIGASWYFTEADLTKEILVDKLSELIENPALLKEASKQLGKRNLNGVVNLSNTILKLLEEKS